MPKPVIQQRFGFGVDAMLLADFFHHRRGKNRAARHRQQPDQRRKNNQLRLRARNRSLQRGEQALHLMQRLHRAAENQDQPHHCGDEERFRINQRQADGFGDVQRHHATPQP